MRTCMQTPMSLYIRLSVCLSVCMYVCIYICVRDKLEQSVHAIGTRILEVCECPESVADRSNGFGMVLGGINRAKDGKNWIGTNSWKSASLQKVPQTNALAFRDSQEF